MKVLVAVAPDGTSPLHPFKVVRFATCCLGPAFVDADPKAPHVHYATAVVVETPPCFAVKPKWTEGDAGALLDRALRIAYRSDPGKRVRASWVRDRLFPAGHLTIETIGAD